MISLSKFLSVKKYLCPLLAVFSALTVNGHSGHSGNSTAVRAHFSHDVETEATPWTHLDFQNNPEEFQFAILSDRTGGHRAGVFPMAIKKLNLLRPEFVLTVGDMIEGMTEDEDRLLAEWKEFNGFLAPLKAPFFYLPGNHDNSNDTMAAVYNRLFGRAYYSFTYRDVFFLCLDTQDEAPSALGEEQLAWAVQELKNNSDARWTFVILHQPLWVYEEGGVQTARKKIGAGRETGFKKITAALGDRDYTVFAGHFHQYVQYVRQDRNHIILGTTGGGNKMRGTDFGEFDHTVWITMTDEGPVIANLMLDEIYDETVHTEQDLNFLANLKINTPDTVDPTSPFEVGLPIHNTFDHVLDANIEWQASADWAITPDNTTARVTGGNSETLAFTLSYTGTDPYPITPKCTGYFSAGDAFMRKIQLPLDLQIGDYLKKHQPETEAFRITEAPLIDGQLSESIWNRPAQVTEFRFQDLSRTSVETEAWIAYDDTYLYVAMRNQEPNMPGILANITEADGHLWDDDSVELFIHPRPNEKAYYQFIVNSEGVLFDSKIFNAHGYTSHAQVAAHKSEREWTVEIAIPWKAFDLDAAPDSDNLMNLLLVRTRTQSGGPTQYPPINASNHTPERFAPLTLAP